MTPITRLLVANRGEIARRIIRTAHEHGIETVAVFSDPDRGAPFVDEATYAVALGGSTSAESYLDAEKVLDAARRAGADSVHPGYGFLSENADFASAAADVGLVWVGPTPESMRAMALKVEAKRIAAAAGVPLVPGAELEPDLSEADLLTRGELVGYPVLVKASAGGGGKGMRIVRAGADLAEAVAGARREALASFGDETVFLERYVERSRHVEVQVFGDSHGSVVHLFERECSIQRRHQKIVEESPSPGATARTLDQLYAAAVSLASAIGYVGAGTVEFLVSGDGAAQEFFFLEMNTRLQVEHPVTEMVTGLDLVEWQILVAQGDPLPLRQNEIQRDGHAIEVRVYAEDPSRDYLPSTGTITAYELLDDLGVRVDDGVARGSVVSPYYDPMLAKVIAQGPDRAAAASRLRQALIEADIAGVATNMASLIAILGSAEFLSGETTTSFLDDNPHLVAAAAPTDVRRLHLAAAAVALLDPATIATRPSERAGTPGGTGWRNVAAAPELVRLRSRVDGVDRDSVVARQWNRAGGRYWIGDAIEGSVAAQEISTDSRFECLDAPRLSASYLSHPPFRTEGRLEVDGIRREVAWRADESVVEVAVGGWRTVFEVVEPWAASSHEAVSAGPATPVPGTVTHVAVAVGDQVVAGQALVVLEAMKMEHTIRADTDGIVEALHVAEGDPVEAHTVVVTLTPTLRP